jgi:hypothetical protein
MTAHSQTVVGDSPGEELLWVTKQYVSAAGANNRRRMAVAKADIAMKVPESATISVAGQ